MNGPDWSSRETLVSPQRGGRCHGGHTVERGPASCQLTLLGLEAPGHEEGHRHSRPHHHPAAQIGGDTKDARMVRGVEQLCCGNRLRELGFWGDLIAASQNVKAAYKRDGDFSPRPVVTGQRIMVLN